MSTITRYLEDRKIEFWTLEHPRAYTSRDEATALGTTPDRIVKTLVLDTDSGHAIAVIPATRRLDKKLLERAVGGHATLATEGEVARDFPDFELGTVPPIGSLLSIPAYVDLEVGFHDNVVFAAGTQTESIEMRTEDLLADGNVRVPHLTRQPSPREDGAT